ncbi:hypothetical protein ETD86_42340, partial [Nonomuraea turkmeniaca]
MNFCLSDLVPPLRWSDASTITLLTGQPDLPDAWWRSLPMPHVLAAIGPESLGELLTEIALEQWPAAAVGDVLPALHVLDPDEADEPAVAIALDRAGSWAGLLGLTSRELVDQPFIQARPVLNTLFSAAFTRLATPQAAPALAPAAAAAVAAGSAVPAPRVEPHGLPGSAPEPATTDGPSRGADKPESVADASSAAIAAEEASAAPQDTDDAEAAERPAGAEQPPPHDAVAFHEGSSGLPDDAPVQGEAASVDEGELAPASAGEDDPEGASEDAPAGTAAHEDVAEEGGPEGAQPVLDADAEPVAQEGDGPERVPDAAEEPASEPAAEEAAALAEGAHLEDAGAPEESAEAEPAEAEAADAADAEAAGTPDTDAADAEHADAEHADAEHADAEHADVEDSDVEDSDVEDSDVEDSDSEDADSEDADAEDADSEEEDAAHEQELPRLIEAAFSGLDDKSWAVAQNRVFTDEPSAVDQLAKLFAVPPAEISATEDEFRDRLNRWLTSEEAAPYRAHLDELRKTLGPAAPKEQLIGAADWHRLEIRALEVPAWQFVLATLPGQAQPSAQSQIDLPPQPMPPPPMDLPAHSAFGPVPMPPP